MGGGGQTELLLITPIPTMAKLVLGRLLQLTAYLLIARTLTIGQGQGNAQRPKNGQGNTSNKKGPSMMSRLGPHGWGMYYPGQIIKQEWGELRECGPTPHQQPTVDLQHSLPDPKPN